MRKQYTNHIFRQFDARHVVPKTAFRVRTRYHKVLLSPFTNWAKKTYAFISVDQSENSGRIVFS